MTTNQEVGGSNPSGRVLLYHLIAMSTSTNSGPSEHFMQLALQQAELARTVLEVPVGAVIVKDGHVIAAAHNITEQNQDVSCHAEIVAIRQAGALRENWRLEGCELYVTLEPCTMCAGAIRLSRFSAVYFGAYDERLGAMGSLYDLGSDPRLGPTPRVVGGILSDQCSLIIRSFFSNSR